MRIAFDGSVIQQNLYGFSRYAYQLAEALATSALTDDDIFILYDPGEPTGQHQLENLTALPNVALRPAAGLGGVRGPFSLASQLRQLDVDVFHSPYQLTRVLHNVPSVVTIHDLSAFQEELGHGLLGKLSQVTANAELTLLRRAGAVICVSESLKHDLLANVDVSEDKVYVVHNGVDHQLFHPRYRPEARKRASLMLGIEPPYVLALATPEPRKNIRGLLEAYARLPRNGIPKLVLAGAGDWGSGTIYETVHELGLEEHVRFTGYVPEAILPDLYGGSRLFVFPSVYEGFGLPVLEALACAAPVVASTGGGIPEVAGEAALLVDPSDPDELAGAMQRVLDSKELRDDLRLRGPGQAARFSWERTARETRRVYTALRNV